MIIHFSNSCFLFIFSHHRTFIILFFYFEIIQYYFEREILLLQRSLVLLFIFWFTSCIFRKQRVNAETMLSASGKKLIRFGSSTICDRRCHPKNLRKYNCSHLEIFRRFIPPVDYFSLDSFSSIKAQNFAMSSSCYKFLTYCCK